MEKAYEAITARMIQLLEGGTVPWHKPWKSGRGHPKNLVSGKEYRGINAFMLSSAKCDSPYWLTFKQAKDRGGTVRKGEHGYPCVYWNSTVKEDPERGERREIRFLRYYTVFNVLQCEGIEYPREVTHPLGFNVLETCDRVVAEMPSPPRIEHGSERASYYPSCDTLKMPHQKSFESPESYYSVLFHELVHSTGHESRLARQGITDEILFGSDKYSKEELIAEMGAAFLCGRAEIESKVIENSASYISSWLERLRNDRRLVVTAASQAQKAADYILNTKKEVDDAMLNMPEESTRGN